jgi:hypothetical protein
MRTQTSTACLLALGALMTTPAFAGSWCNRGCEPVREAAIVRPAHTTFEHSPAVMGTRVQRVETQPGYWTATKMPAQVGYFQKSVIARPAHVSYRMQPAQYETVHETVVVRAASVHYEMQRDHRGHMVRCPVHVPAVTRTVAKRVMVSPAHSVAHTTPAEYRTVTVPMQIQPAKMHYQYTAPQVQYVAHPITLQGPTVRAIHHPAQVISPRRGHWPHH